MDHEVFIKFSVTIFFYFYRNVCNIRLYLVAWYQSASVSGGNEVQGLRHRELPITTDSYLYKFFDESVSLNSWISLDFPSSISFKTQRFGSWLCFRRQVKHYNLSVGFIEKKSNLNSLSVVCF
jgi:hypothetical protein